MVREMRARPDAAGAKRRGAALASPSRCVPLVAALVGGALTAACSKDASPVPTASAEPALHSIASAMLKDAAPATPPAPPPGPPTDSNVVLISIDSLRADMPWNGYERPIAPRITELEKTAVSYTRAHSVSSYTAMSLGGLLGGRLPSELHRSGYFFGQYQNDVFFPKLLQKAGVHTMGVQAHFYFQQSGLEQGFDAWRVVPGVTFDGQTSRDITSPTVPRRLREAARRPDQRDAPLLLLGPLPRPPRPLPAPRGHRLGPGPARPLRRRGHLHRPARGQAARLHRREAVGEADHRHRHERPRRGVRRAPDDSPRFRGVGDSHPRAVDVRRTRRRARIASTRSGARSISRRRSSTSSGSMRPSRSKDTRWPRRSTAAR